MKAISVRIELVLVVLVFSVTAAAYADRLEVTPSDHDFGEVEVGASSTAIISLTNVNGSNVTVSRIEFQGGSSGDFSLVDPVPTPFDIAFGGTSELQVGFCPSSEGCVSATLEIHSSNGISATQEVALQGLGIAVQPPPVTIADILAFFDSSVADGTLIGKGPGRSAQRRLKALRNMLAATADLIEDGLYEEACEQLWDALMKCDGEAVPPDFVAGSGAWTLAGMILDLMAALGCACSG